MQSGRRTVLAMFSLIRLTPLQAQGAPYKIEQLMTPQEMRDTGVSSLTPSPGGALSRWLTRYTEAVASVVRRSRFQDAGVQPRKESGSPSSPAIESSISGDSEGWDGETVFRLDNSRIWEQAEYDYTDDYQYHPDVTIYPTSSGMPDEDGRR
jgi:hypothetical protein